MNTINCTGRITKDLELKTTPTGISVCSFALAVKRPKAKDTTDFIDFVAYRQTAEYLCNYGRKGVLIEVSGYLTSRKWEDRNGNKRTSYEVVVDNASILESRNSSTSVDVNPDADPLQSFATTNSGFVEIGDNSDLPFN